MPMAATAALFIILILHQTTSESPFKRTCLNLHRPSIYLSGVCIVLHQGNAKNRVDANTQCNTDYNGHLATIYSQAQIDKIAAIVDMSILAWCDLKRHPNATNIWLHAPTENGPNPKAISPPWDPSITNNPSLTGNGVLVGENGMQDEDVTVIHPFLCEYAEPVSDPTEYNKRNTGYRASDDDALNEWTVDNIFVCAQNCDQMQACRSFAFSEPSKACHLYTLPNEALSLTSDADYELFDKIMKDSDCVSPMDCKTEIKQEFLEATHFLFIGGEGTPNIESYYPLHPSSNGIVATLSGDLKTCMAEWCDAKVMIIGGWNILSTWLVDPETYVTVPGPDMPAPGISNGASTTLHGAVVVCGGWDYTASDFTARCIRFQNYQWESLPALNHKRKEMRLTNFNNKLYGIGGSDGGGYDLLERFDPDMNSWTVLNQMPIRGSVSGAAVFDGTIFLCGGFLRYQVCHKYHEALDQWVSIGSTNAGRFGAHLLVFNDNLYLVGDVNSSQAQEKRLEIYNSANDTWSFVATERIENRRWFSALLV